MKVAMFPARTRMLSAPPRARIAITCVFCADAGRCAGRTVQRAIPRVASNATMRPSVITATISELPVPLRWATIERATSPIAAYQPPLELTVSVALLVTAGGVGLGFFESPFAGTTITPADENSPRFAFSDATRQ